MVSHGTIFQWVTQIKDYYTYLISRIIEGVELLLWSASEL